MQFFKGTHRYVYRWIHIFKHTINENVAFKDIFINYIWTQVYKRIFANLINTTESTHNQCVCM